MEEVLTLLQAVGCPVEGLLGSRKLVHDFPEAGWRYLVVRTSDVPTYVEYGVADLGVVGKDDLLEERREVAELVDLGFGRCRLAVAVPAGSRDLLNGTGIGRIRVATKYPRLAEEHFHDRGIQAEIIHLRGSVELAPLLGLSDVIVDLVSTGRTLAENNLVAVEDLAVATARLICNRVSFRLYHSRISAFSQAVREAAGVAAGGVAGEGNAELQ
ncbi:MAG: ATP phosphoribosyltransferase [Firmicutes bacterium]|nr:ATP phosphoribosyltransferase [Bacillota bacterium]